MTEQVRREQDTSATDAGDVSADDPLPSTNDPGGAHAKGYSADPLPGKDPPAEGPVPLAPAPASPPRYASPSARARSTPRAGASRAPARPTTG
jgi:hypothetical protein